MSAADARLAWWLRLHRNLQPVEVSQGECSMALLLLWEVQHSRSFPAIAADRTGVLMGFTKRLLKRVPSDDELWLWLTTKDVQQPLAPGLPELRHT